MAQTKPDYRSSKIFVITNTINNMKYVGGTVGKLENILANYKEQSKDITSKSKLSEAMREFDEKSFTIHLLEDYPCTSFQELSEREKKWIKELNSNKVNIGYN